MLIQSACRVLYIYSEKLGYDGKTLAPRVSLSGVTYRFWLHPQGPAGGYLPMGGGSFGSTLRRACAFKAQD
jgi:hypothetical protein